jgi:hypothetical protein
MLRQQADVVNDQWRKAYDHFRKRLNDRYNIDVSFPEYVLLTKQRVERIENQSQNKCIGWLKIRGVNVVVVKEIKRSRFLSTVLQSNLFMNKKSNQ